MLFVFLALVNCYDDDDERGTIGIDDMYYLIDPPEFGDEEVLLMTRDPLNSDDFEKNAENIMKTENIPEKMNVYATPRPKFKLRSFYPKYGSKNGFNLTLELDIYVGYSFLCRFNQSDLSKCINVAGSNYSCNVPRMEKAGIISLDISISDDDWYFVGYIKISGRKVLLKIIISFCIGSSLLFSYRFIKQWARKKFKNRKSDDVGNPLSETRYNNKSNRY